MARVCQSQWFSPHVSISQGGSLKMSQAPNQFNAPFVPTQRCSAEPSQLAGLCLPESCKAATTCVIKASRKPSPSTSPQRSSSSSSWAAWPRGLGSEAHAHATRTRCRVTAAGVFTARRSASAAALRTSTRCLRGVFGSSSGSCGPGRGALKRRTTCS